MCDRILRRFLPSVSLALGLLAVGCSASSVGNGTPAECQAAKAGQLPAWLNTSVPPGAQVTAKELRYVQVGVKWNLAVAEDSTLSVHFWAPDVYLDDERLNDAEGVGIFGMTIAPGSWVLRYPPENVELGLRTVRVTVRDAEERTFRFEWQFCLK